MRYDVPADLHKAAAAEKGRSFESFRKNIKPVLQAKGRRAKKDMTDPLTGETVSARPGSDRRLKTTCNVNMRTAYPYRKYESGMESGPRHYIIYDAGTSTHRRPVHESYTGFDFTRIP